MSPIRKIICLIKKPASRLTSIITNNTGVSAIEFALIAPFLLLLLFGGTELLQGILISRQVTLAATTVANIVTQYTSISSSNQMPDVLDASAQIFAPNPSSNATIVVSLVTIDGSGKAAVTWSQTLNGTARATGQSITVPASLDIPNTALIYSEATYAYTPIFDFMHLGTFNMYDSIFMGPREATTINLTP